MDGGGEEGKRGREDSDEEVGVNPLVKRVKEERDVHAEHVRCANKLLLLLEIAALGTDGRTALHLICDETRLVDDPLGDVKMLEYVLGMEEMAREVNNPDRLGNFPLHRAAYRGRSQMAEVLLSHGAQVDARTVGENPDNPTGRTPLHVAADCRNGPRSVEVARVLVRWGASVNAASSNEHRTPLIVASKMLGVPGWGDMSDHLDMISLLLENGANVLASNKSHRTVIHHASGGGLVGFDSSEAVVMLHQAGALLDGRDHNGLTPLHMAAACDRAPVMRYLLDQGVDLEPWNNVGETPLHQASLRSRQKSVRLLVSEGADVESVTWEKARSPLQNTTWRTDRWWRDESTRYLLGFGVDLSTSSCSWHTDVPW